MVTSLTATIVSREQVTPVHVRLRLRAPEIAASARAGQFVHLRVSQAWDPLLRRPFSIMLTEPATGLIDLLVQVVGRGSEALAAAVPGQCLDLIGPLGNGFPLAPAGSQVLLVAGGVGVAPLIALAQALAEAEGEREIIGLFGARAEGLLCCWLELAARCTEFTAVTEDGSIGETGLVSGVLARRLQAPFPGKRVIYACGPMPMLAAIAAIGGESEVETYVSLERWMGCGVGACLGCVVPAAPPAPGTTGVSPVDHPDGTPATATGETPVVPPERYLRVCKDGPVFPAGVLDWEAMPR
jgi:dihydroorotate dehydrogenase electron transfer subunit